MADNPVVQIDLWWVFQALLVEALWVEVEWMRGELWEDMLWAHCEFMVVVAWFYNE